MKLLLILCAAAVMFAADDPKTTKKKPQTNGTAQAAKPLTGIPASAVEFEPGSFHYVDPEGKKWILRKTPFGIARIEDTGEPPKKEVDHSLDAVKVIDLGESVRFERPGPFGTYKWEKKKTDLDDQEKAAWEREKTRAAAKQN